jgi:DNA-binding transcriptional MerR regulator
MSAFVTIQELAARTGVPERTLRYAAKKGVLVTRRFGLRKHYVPADVAAQFAAEANCKKSGNNGNNGNSGNRAA